MTEAMESPGTSSGELPLKVLPRQQVERLLGWTALLAPLPLPLNGALGWPEVILHGALVTLFLVRLRHGEKRRPLPRWAMNLLGLAYVPILLLDLRMIVFRGQLIQTVVHVCMFAVIVKLFALHRLRDVWQTLGAVFFIFLASAATSVHPSVVLYLLVFSGVALTLLARLSMLAVLPSYGPAGRRSAQVPLRGFITAVIVAAVVLGAPLFFFFPRVNAPYMGIQGTGTGTEIFSTGFSDEVTLDAIGRQRDNPAVALRLRYEGPPPPEESIRLKGGTFDFYRGKRWLAAPRVKDVLQQDGQFVLADEPVRQRVEIWMQPQPARALLLPVESVALELDVPVLQLDGGGAVSMLRRPSSGLAYKVDLAGEEVPLALPVESGEGGAVLDHKELSERAQVLAERILGDGPDHERVARLERYFQENFTFSLEFMGRTGDAPLDDFLFDIRQGHCELFASSMVLLLRSQGIPARLVTGFLGGEYNPLTGFFVVRQGNAHAWVEAYLEGEGWTTLDPTPPAGLPGSVLKRGSLLQQMYDFVMFRWDRYVLTYGMQDQVSVLETLMNAWQRVRSWFEEEEQLPPAVSDVVTEEVAAPPRAPARDDSILPWVLLPLVLAALGAAFVIYRRRRLTATKAFQKLRRRLASVGVSLPPSTAPKSLERRAAEAFPEASEPTARIVDFYLKESFGGHELGQEEREELHGQLKAVSRALPRRRAS